MLKVYVAATRQNDGKTTAALGLLDAIRELFPKVGYIKPVGQNPRGLPAGRQRQGLYADRRPFLTATG